MIFEFRLLKEGLYIIMYEWEKYEVKIKSCDFGPKTHLVKMSDSVPNGHANICIYRGDCELEGAF